jgi:membrane-bound lytic murein transglycosylase MltF
MVNAGLIPLTVAANFAARFWKQVLPKTTMHEAIALRTGGNLAWTIRKDSPQLKDAASEAERKKFLALIQFFQRYGDTRSSQASTTTYQAVRWRRPFGLAVQHFA